MSTQHSKTVPAVRQFVLQGQNYQQCKRGRSQFAYIFNGLPTPLDVSSGSTFPHISTIPGASQPSSSGSETLGSSRQGMAGHGRAATQFDVESSSLRGFAGGKERRQKEEPLRRPNCGGIRRDFRHFASDLFIRRKLNNTEYTEPHKEEFQYLES